MFGGNFEDYRGTAELPSHPKFGPGGVGRKHNALGRVDLRNVSPDHNAALPDSHTSRCPPGMTPKGAESAFEQSVYDTSEQHDRMKVKVLEPGAFREEQPAPPLAPLNNTRAHPDKGSPRAASD
jgi:hypothetical protein